MFPTATVDNKQTGTNQNMGDGTTVQMSINSGTSIIEVIGLAIKNSSYIYNQIMNPVLGQVTVGQLKEFQSKPLKWYKIIPRISLFD